MILQYTTCEDYMVYQDAQIITFKHIGLMDVAAPFREGGAEYKAYIEAKKLATDGEEENRINFTFHNKAWDTIYKHILHNSQLDEDSRISHVYKCDLVSEVDVATVVTLISDNTSNRTYIFGNGKERNIVVYLLNDNGKTITRVC
jgi:hypothetical protein